MQMSNYNITHQQAKDKNRMVILVDREKALDKIQYPFNIKPLKKAGIGRAYLNIIKAAQHKQYYMKKT